MHRKMILKGITCCSKPLKKYPVRLCLERLTLLVLVLVHSPLAEPIVSRDAYVSFDIREQAKKYVQWMKVTFNLLT